MDIYNSSIVMQTAQSPLNNAVIAAIISATLVGIVTYFANRRLEVHKAEIQAQQQKRQAYSQLRGINYTLSQVYTTRYEMFICAVYYKYLSQQADNQPDRSEYIEKMKEFEHRSDDLIMEMAKNDQRLWELIGFIETLFPHTQELDGYIKQLEKYREAFEQEFEIKTFSEDDELVDNEDQKDIERIFHEMKEKVVTLSNEKIDIPVENLLKYLKNEIEKINSLNKANESLEVWRTTILP